MEPPFIKPMLAASVDESFNDPEWIFETKWDGYRALAYISKNINLYSRNKTLFNALFPSILVDLSKLHEEAILDGEIVILDQQGKSNFQMMQNYQKTKQGALYYYVFDLLFLNGKDLRSLPLIERKKQLKKLLKSVSLERVRFSDHIIAKGIPFFKKAQEYDLEGIMAKNMNSVYVSARSKQWLKIKTHHRQEAIISGFTVPRGSRQKFGALVLGVYNDKNEFVNIGLVGTGFTEQSLQDIFKKMTPLIQKKSPFASPIKTNMHITWLKPKLICEVSFAEWTQDGKMRQPSFVGLRMDKSAVEVIHEESDKTHFSNLDKIYWPKEKYTKSDLIEYYQQVSPFILPYLKDRPTVLRRFPDGIEGENFVQKDTKNLHLPSWIKTVDIPHEEKHIKYFIIKDQAALEYIVNLGSIELHPFHSRIEQLDYPDYFILDLDPESVPFDTVIKTTQTIHQLLDSFVIPNFCKTSGGRGIHIYIPLHAAYTIKQVAHFGQILGILIHQELPKITSLERSPAKRQKKIYLDVLQNRPRQTVVAPYSVRGKPHATVSTPLHWDELVKGLQPTDFTIKTILPRLNKIGDIFTPILGKGFNMKKWLSKITLPGN